mgnify:FL=1
MIQKTIGIAHAHHSSSYDYHFPLICSHVLLLSHRPGLLFITLVYLENLRLIPAGFPVGFSRTSGRSGGYLASFFSMSSLLLL